MDILDNIDDISQTYRLGSGHECFEGRHIITQSRDNEKLLIDRCCLQDGRTKGAVLFSIKL